MNKGVAAELTTAILLIAFGGCVYIAFRSPSLRMFGWFNTLGLYNVIVAVRETAKDIQIPDVIKYCLPDGLWTLSYILFMDAIWAPDLKKQLLFSSIIPVIGSISELLQYVGAVRGTFDIIDLLFYSVPYIVFLILKL